jgi:protein ImuB
MADANAGAAGILPGMAIADVRALLPDLIVRPADPAGDEVALARLADWCGRYTPWIAVDGANERANGDVANDAISGIGEGIWLDITGCAHLAGGENALLEDLSHRVARFGFDVQAGLADTPGAAWAAARFIAASDRPAILAPGSQRSALEKLPVAALRLDGAMVAELDRLGLRRIGDLYPMPRAALVRRFGTAVGQRLDQAIGRLEEPISPRRPAPRHIVRFSFAEPVVDEASILAALTRLAPALCRGLEAEGLGARRLTIALYRVDGTVRELTVGTARPGREPAALLRLFAPQLETVDAGFGIETVTLAASVAEPLSALQMVIGRTALLAPAVAPSEMSDVASPATPETAPLATSAPVSTAALDHLFDSLGNRLGFDALNRLAPRDSHAPERAQQRVPVERAAAMPSWWRERPRPLRLLAEPVPLPVTEDAGGAPFALRDRQRLRRIAVAEGPERIEPEWWRPPAEGDRPARDYWRVEDEEGGRFWLYRERSGSEPRWFLHGLFA